jgi:putative exporter of polyketide antibiotics
VTGSKCNTTNKIMLLNTTLLVFSLVLFVLGVVYADMFHGARFHLKINYSVSQLRYESRAKFWVLGK